MHGRLALLSMLLLLRVEVIPHERARLVLVLVLVWILEGSIAAVVSRGEVRPLVLVLDLVMLLLRAVLHARAPTRAKQAADLVTVVVVVLVAPAQTRPVVAGVVSARVEPSLGIPL